MYIYICIHILFAIEQAMHDTITVSTVSPWIDSGAEHSISNAVCIL